MLPLPILRYFAWSHLPPGLQTISQPFGDLAYLVAVTPPGTLTEEMSTQLERIQEVLGPTPSDEAAKAEWDAAKIKIQMFCSEWEREDVSVSHCVRLLLEAKDCAVRTRV